MKEVLNSSWHTEHFTVISNVNDLLKGVFIWVFNWDKIPHLGLSIDGVYFSSTLQGPQIEEDANKFYRLSINKNIPTFFVKIDFEIQKQDCAQIFSQAPLGSQTCLHPIKEVLQCQSTQIKTLSDLLLHLKSNHKIKSYHSNMPTEILYLAKYSEEDVLQLIQKSAQ